MTPEEYAEMLAVKLHKKHWSHVTNWKPLTGDLMGLLSQIDNMTSGMVREQRGGTMINE